ncbi:UNVERIFIED_CONTAM: hypothetical protein RMT77_003808 [Armadillidium vulgare]
MNLLVALFMVSVSVSLATFNKGGGGCRNRIHFIPHYITKYQKVPVYETVYKEVAVPSPVPKILYETKFLKNYVTKTNFHPVYKTVYEPQIVPQAVYDTIYQTKFVQKYVPQYVTQTEFQPKFITHTVDVTQTIPVPELVTVCPVYGGYGKQEVAESGYGY